MTKPKRAQSPFRELATAVETLTLEAAPLIARIGQETGLGASLPDTAPRRVPKSPARKRSGPASSSPKKKTITTKPGRRTSR
jgi:hypothetical protein